MWVPETLFYLDPPYLGCEDYYGKGLFSRRDFAALRSLLIDVKGKWIMSINDRPEIRRLFGDFTVHEVSTAYQQAGAHRRKHVTELLVTNY